MTKINENKLIIFLAVFLMVAMVLGIFIFIDYKKDSNREKEAYFLFEKKKECKAMCDKILNYKISAETINHRIDAPIYVYNERLNTCLVSSGSHWRNDNLEPIMGLTFIKDCLTGETIAQLNDKSSPEEVENYYYKFKKLMSN